MDNRSSLSILTQNERDFLLLHLVFGVGCALALLAPMDVSSGVRMLILVLSYNLMISFWGLRRGYDDWLSLWFFALVLSLFQIFPDWFLSAQLGILAFPEDGLFKIGTVSGYMGGLWVIPIILIVYIGRRMEARFSRAKACFGVGLASLLIFGASEQTSWTLSAWYAQNVIMVGHAAVYILIPEIILGLSAFFCFQQIETKSHWLKIPAGFLLMQLYLGSAVFFYFLVEIIAKP